MILSNVGDLITSISPSFSSNFVLRLNLITSLSGESILGCCRYKLLLRWVGRTSSVTHAIEAFSCVLFKSPFSKNCCLWLPVPIIRKELENQEEFPILSSLLKRDQVALYCLAQYLGCVNWWLEPFVFWFQGIRSYFSLREEVQKY